MGILRLLLALSVVVWHSHPIFGLTFVGGPNAVDVFFAISGFYMALILSEKYQGNYAATKLFLSNRFLKIFPTYWICLFIAVIVGILGIVFIGDANIFQPYIDFAGKMNALSLLYLIAANLLIFGQDISLFLGFSSETNRLYFTNSYESSVPQVTNFFPISQAWSIALELLFYLCAPFLNKLKTGYLLIIIFAGLALRFGMYNAGLRYDPWTYRFFPIEITFFIMGIVSYRIYKKFRNGEKIKIIGWFAFLISIIAVFTYPLYLNHFDTEIKRWVMYAFTIPCIPFIFQIFNNNKIDRVIGELSYPVYLSHRIFIYLLYELMQFKSDNGIYVAIMAIIFSLLLLKFVVNPIDKLRQSRVGTQL